MAGKVQSAISMVGRAVVYSSMDVHLPCRPPHISEKLFITTGMDDYAEENRIVILVFLCAIC